MADPAPLSRLSALADQPPGVAESTIALLPYRDLRELVTAGVIEPVDLSGDAANEIVITPHGWEAISRAS